MPRHALPSLVLLSAVTALCLSSLTGCGFGSTASPTNHVGTIAQSGRAYGGQQPVANARIDIWKAGTAGYGMGATRLYNTTTDVNGTFFLTGNYTCAFGDQIYMTAYGGNSNGGGTANSSIGLMAALGECTAVQATPFIYVSEASTVAGMTALQQFSTVNFGTSGLAYINANTLNVPVNIGTTSSNPTGLANAFAAVQNLQPPTTGNYIPQSYTRQGIINGTVTTVTVTPPYQKIATLANILASCVNTSDGAGPVPSSTCSSVFTAAKPATQTSAPADTVQVMMDIAINPTNVGSTGSGLYFYSTPSAPFQPALSAAPNDYSLGLSYTSATLTGTVGAGGTPAYFLYSPTSLQIDAAGNVYYTNALGGNATTSPYYGSVGEISTIGTPVSMYFQGATSGVAYPKPLAIDPSGNIFTANAFTTQVTEYASGIINKYTVAGNAKVLVSDGGGNVFATSATPALYRITAGAATATAATLIAALPNNFTQYIAVDSGQNVWLSATAASSSAGDQYVDYFPCTSGAGPCTAATANTYPTTPTKFTSFPTINGAIGVPAGIGIDANNNAFLGLNPYGLNGGFGCQFLLTATTVASSTTPACSANEQGGMDTPEQSQIDGLGNIWAANGHTLGSGGYPLASLTYSAGTYTAPITNIKGLNNAAVGSPVMQIDSSGNIWETSTTAVSSLYYVFETVGVAAPAVTPLSLAVKTGMLGTRP